MSRLCDPLLGNDNLRLNYLEFFVLCCGTNFFFFFFPLFALYFFVRTLSCLLFRPNDGFMTQLNLYGDIEYDVDVSRTAYRRFLIASMAAQRESMSIPLRSFFFVDCERNL